VIVAELRPPGRSLALTPYPALEELARAGKARLGAGNRSDLYPTLEPALGEGEAGMLLDQERGER
jgi:hypothetical protein